MKVKCVKLVHPRTGELVQSDSWLRVGNIYHVLEIFFEEKGALSFRILSEDKITPAYFDADQFELVSDTISKEWCIKMVQGSYLKLTPREFAVDSFWDAYFDREPDAEETFKQVHARMVAEEP